MLGLRRIQGYEVTDTQQRMLVARNAVDQVLWDYVYKEATKLALPPPPEQTDYDLFTSNVKRALDIWSALYDALDKAGASDE